MAELVSVEDFINDTLKDIQSPSHSEFSSKISSIRQTVYYLDEGLNADRALIAKSRKFVKGVVGAGIAYVDAILALCDHLENLGQFAQLDNNNGSDLTPGFWKFSVIHRDLGNMFRHLMQNLNSILVFPMEIFLQGDLKSDLKKPFDKSLKEYEYKYSFLEQCDAIALVAVAPPSLLNLDQLLSDKLKKEKLQAMKETGLYTPESFTVEMAENLEKERRRLQLEVCEYFIKVNEVKSKKGSDFLQHLVDFYHAHLHYLRESLGVMEHFGKTLPDLASSISGLQKQHDSQKRQLVDTREAVRKLIEKESVQPVNSGYLGAQALPLNLAYGKRKSGFLLKKSDSKVIKRLWQRRRVCVGENGEFCLYHADETKPPVRLSLLTCQLKLPPTPNTDQSSTVTATTAASIETAPTMMEASDSTVLSTSATAATNSNKRSFFLVSNNRTYQFQAEDDKDFEEWTNVLSNAMQAAFNEAMHHPDWKSRREIPQSTLCDLDMSNSMHHHGHQHHSRESSLNGSDTDLLESHFSHGVGSRSSHSSTVGSDEAATVTFFNGLSGAQLHHSIQHVMRTKVPGNRVCADCNRPDPEWVSVNLGVLICLECCGTHRELGVQYSRTQSLLMDDLSAAQLLLPRFIGNRLFNEVYESALVDGVKPTPDSDSASRRAYIRSKYLEHKFTMGGSIINRRHVRQGSYGDDDDDRQDDRFLRRQLLIAIRNADLRALLQVHAEGVDLTAPLDVDCEADVGGAEKELVEGDTTLHVAIASAATSTKSCEASSSNTSLAFVQFILQNAPSSAVILQRANAAGETALHYAAKFALPDFLRLLLGAGVSGSGGVGWGALPTTMLTAVNKLKQTPLDVIEARLSTSSSSINAEVEALRRCEHLLQLAMDASTAATDTASGVDCAPPAFLTSTSPASMTTRELAARKRLLEALDDLESVRWDAFDSRPLSVTSAAVNTFLKQGDSFQDEDATDEEDGLTRAFRETLAGAFKLSDSSFSRSPPLTFSSRDQWRMDNGNSSCRRPNHRLSKRADTSAAALATLPRKKGPAPQPPLVENACFSFSDTRSSRTLASPLRAPSSPLASDHIEVLLDVLEEHPGTGVESSPPPLPPTSTAAAPPIAVASATADSGGGKSVTNEPPAALRHQRAVALYDCDAENPDELTFRRSEVIVVVKDVEVNCLYVHGRGCMRIDGLAARNDAIDDDMTPLRSQNSTLRVLGINFNL
ncbi:Arf-GAP with SH3 domain, ANK repeat and PH domain-containing protein [Echinococcus granulosus]|uniref:Arf-GAP with SH3 domain, ANK repeat and PH domain-containing protein n=1 Tax=Echinococcus granulosus TaxID=6210 RepID=W6U331_ECHGR|nr:Arf-GAP with SH3 domain, ANK repeat and PH domain-containing protein [Echinococcus granulosus]EUB55488.1 Arf-GAP with SH3 domain, ANK repeat and PH domain-containing protein [Echinococcus granulosus]